MNHETMALVLPRENGCPMACKWNVRQNRWLQLQNLFDAAHFTYPRSPVCEGLEDHQQEERQCMRTAEQPELQDVVVQHHTDYAKSRSLWKKVTRTHRRHNPVED